MPLTHPPTENDAREVPDYTVSRRFKVDVRCWCCKAEGPVVVEMIDEPGCVATETDFYESGAHKQIDPTCPKCGNRGITILGAVYLRAPGEQNPAAMAEV